MNKKCFAPRKYFTKNNEVVYYLPAKVEILMPMFDKENKIEYWVKYCNEGIKTNMLTTNKNDVTSAIFDDFYDCFDYCKNVNNVIFEPFATSCNFFISLKYKNKKLQRNNSKKKKKE